MCACFNLSLSNKKHALSFLCLLLSSQNDLPLFSRNAWSLLINQKWYVFLSCNVSLLARHILWIDLEGKLLRAWTRQKQIFYAWKKEIFWAYESFFWKPLSQYFFFLRQRDLRTNGGRGQHILSSSWQQILSPRQPTLYVPIIRIFSVELFVSSKNIMSILIGFDVGLLVINLQNI